MSTILLSNIPFPTHNHSLSNHLSYSPKFPFNSSSIYPSKPQFQLGLFATKSPFFPNSYTNEEYPLGSVEVLRVPDHWLEPSNALMESEWLRVAVHKWLDDEYCPEPTNFDISRVAANSYYQSLLKKTTDVGEILLKMARELETISYQESFHGPFSAANAAVSLIAERIESNGS
ncbi:U3 small nucleolar RNA-associated protein 10 [Bienertia sinuspersici]